MLRRLPPSRRRWLQRLDAIADGIIRGVKTAGSTFAKAHPTQIWSMFIILMLLGILVLWGVTLYRYLT